MCLQFCEGTESCLPLMTSFVDMFPAVVVIVVVVVFFNYYLRSDNCLYMGKRFCRDFVGTEAHV